MLCASHSQHHLGRHKVVVDKLMQRVSGHVGGAAIRADERPPQSACVCYTVQTLQNRKEAKVRDQKPCFIVERGQSDASIASVDGRAGISGTAPRLKHTGNARALLLHE